VSEARCRYCRRAIKDSNDVLQMTATALALITTAMFAATGLLDGKIPFGLIFPISNLAICVVWIALSKWIARRKDMRSLAPTQPAQKAAAVDERSLADSLAPKHRSDCDFETPPEGPQRVHVVLDGECAGLAAHQDADFLVIDAEQLRAEAVRDRRDNSRG
jgi:hypothetical protein